MYILILLFVTSSGGYDSVRTEGLYFRSAATCNAAGQQVSRKLYELNRQRPVTFFCVEA